MKNIFVQQKPYQTILSSIFECKNLFNQRKNWKGRVGKRQEKRKMWKSLLSKGNRFVAKFNERCDKAELGRQYFITKEINCKIMKVEDE